MRRIDPAPVLGERGEPTTLGILAPALIIGGTIKAMIKCFKAYFAREHSLTSDLGEQMARRLMLPPMTLTTRAAR